MLNAKPETPTPQVTLPALTDKDKADLKFGCEQVALSLSSRDVFQETAAR